MIQYLNLFVFNRNINNIKINIAKCTTGYIMPIIEMERYMYLISNALF
ncbi:hypothetical protein Barb4_00562 [Bacteroidales bacterium Barb4]|nr:hypothetical protein Barb4_00562 [Bacteroidales bacterium Barb4]